MSGDPAPARRAPDELTLAGQRIGIGERREVALEVGQSYSGVTVAIPVHVWRGPAPGPTVFVTGAVHGDEINGAGIVRAVLLREPFRLRAGSLILVPVVNILGFERHSRYLPDRRDLNRCFPGSAEGSLARRFAHRFFSEVVERCDFGIDLHSAAVRRTNFPNVRADLRHPETRRLAVAFGCELVVHGNGVRGSLRAEACRAGRPTILLEAGEVFKVEASVVECGIRGIKNVLIELGMVEGEPERPAYQVVVRRRAWVRAKVGGFLDFHVTPGAVVTAGQPIATNTSLLGREQNVLLAPHDGVVLGMTTLPAVSPGDPVCHLALLPRGAGPVRRAVAGLPAASLHERLRDDLSAGLSVSPREEG